jgi:hypothetical protein
MFQLPITFNPSFHMAPTRTVLLFISLLLFASITAPATTEVIELQRSSNLQDWETVPLTPSLLTGDGRIRQPSGEHAMFFRLVARQGEPGNVPEGMVRVAGGQLPATTPPGPLDVSTFFMGSWEVTWGEWKSVRSWAASNGYDIGSAGQGCQDHHPVHSVNWYDVLKWCNAKSEMEGLQAVYAVGGSVYRSAEVVPVWESSASGYRLPTEAEWQFAASGGTSSQGYTYSGSNNPSLVAWYAANSGGAACNLAFGRGTWPVGR